MSSSIGIVLLLLELYQCSVIKSFWWYFYAHPLLMVVHTPLFVARVLYCLFIYLILPFSTNNIIYYKFRCPTFFL